MPPTEIFRGVFYSCQRLPATNQGSGLMYLVRVDLGASGIKLFTTPLDADAVSRGWEYRLKFTSAVVRDQHLAVAVNGTLYKSDSTFIPLRGDFSRGIETLVSNHVADHAYAYDWLLWFDDDLTPHLGEHRPPTPQELARAMWGMGCQLPILRNGQINGWASTQCDRRTALGIDSAKKMLWIACFESASPHRIAEILAQQGAVDAITLDGGTSTAMAIGPHAAALRPGDVIGDWKPVANHFGIYAEPLAH